MRMIGETEQIQLASQPSRPSMQKRAFARERFCRHQVLLEESNFSWIADSQAFPQFLGQTETCRSRECLQCRRHSWRWDYLASPFSPSLPSRTIHLQTS